MSPGHYLEPPYPTYHDLSSLLPHAIDLDLEPYRLPDHYSRNFSSHHGPAGCPTGILPRQYEAAHDPVGIFPTQDEPLWHQPLTVWLID